MKVLFGLLIGYCVGAAVANFVVFGLTHRWINLGSGIFCLGCGVVNVFMMRATLRTEAETRRIRAKTEQVRRQLYEQMTDRWLAAGVDPRLIEITKPRDKS